MEKYKKLKLSLITLLLALMVALTAAVFAIGGKTATAFADDRLVKLDGNSVFYTSIGGAEIEATDPDNTAEDAVHYTLFKIGNEETLAYRQNLAYKWISGDKNEAGEVTGHSEKTFSMELYFPEVAFEKYYIKFESQQYTLTKDGKSVNYLVFTPNAGKTGVDIYVSQDLEVKEEDKIGSADKDAHIKIAFGAYDSGEYEILLNGSSSGNAFKNVYENFASYVASGDNAVTPLTFGAEFTEEGKADNEAQMVLVDINGQSFKMKKDAGEYKVVDTAPPVLCFEQTPSYLEYGKSIGFSFKVIDVLQNITSASSYAKANYYVLTGEQVMDEEFDYDRIDYTSEGSGDAGEGGDAAEDKKSPFVQVSSSSSERIYPDENTFIPRAYLDSDVMGLVKIYYEIYDYTSSSSRAQKDKVFVDWYAKSEALVDVYGYNTAKGQHSDFIKLIKNKDGATYAREADLGASDPLAAYKKSVQDFQSDYQTKIDDAIYAMEDHKLYAGGNKFYLPAIEWEFIDDYLTGTDYKYSIYYKGKSSGTHSSLAANKLAIDLNDADTTYRFTIFITDAFGNPMRYPTTGDDGELVWEEITTSDVWEEDFGDLLPYFEFDVSYKEATAEPPEYLSISYVQTNYSGVSFKITGVSGTYTPTYKLYVFDRNSFYNDTRLVLDYDTFVKNTQAIFDNEFELNGTKLTDVRKYFTSVKPISSLLETDENYDKFKALNWNASSISFTPQSVEDFYVLKLELTDNRTQEEKTYFTTVAASVQTTPLKGETESWIENNKTSVVLFVVAGVCLLALIALLVIKPKDKGDIDEIYAEVEGGGNGDGKAKSEKKRGKRK